ncbi:MAG: sigma 54-interacting transcriptional regulator, partial [Kiritimatiellae bacterium]|nr:sigma 54-interacting transcriptional regulator [Kiritimatiellia bacterium]
SPDRRSVDLRMGGGGGLADALVKVRSVLNQMRAEKRVSVRLYEGEDARLLQMTILFDAFHRWAHEYDRLIREQAAEGDRPVAARFVADVLDHLIAHGIRQAEAVRLVAIFYQLRRAYTFIQTGLVGTSPCMQALRVRLWNNIFTCNLRLYIEALLSRMEDFSTMLLGETGTGKGAAASAIGRSGFIPYRPETGRFAESFAGNFLSINLSQYPEALVESELFGHRKGAFTGAVTDHDGVFARCSPNGSIFLDEIGEVPETLQIKLLQVLQERSF